MTEPIMIEAQKKLIASVVAGDRDAGEQFVEAFQGTIWYALSQLNLSEEEKQDLFIQAMGAFWEDNCRRLRNWAGRCSLQTYLYRVTRNLAIDYLRQRKRLDSMKAPYYRRDQQSHDPESGEEWEEIPVAEPCPGPEAMLLLKDQTAAVAAALARLNPLEQQILVCQSEGQKHREIAAVIGRDVKQIGSLLARAKKKLKKILREENPGMFEGAS